jgi:aspartate/methionine/tyrosine aminotransferase
MFSRRTDFEGEAHELALLRAKLLAAGEPVLDLTESNPTRCGLAYPEGEILGALAQPAALFYEPDARGMRRAREELAAWLSRPVDAARPDDPGPSPGASPRVDPDHLVLTASTSEAYAWLMKILCEPGDEILIPSPSYPLFDYIAQLEGVELTRFPLVYDGAWRLPDDLARRVGPRTRAVIVVQPNNPTGSLLSESEREAIDSLAGAKSLAVIADEVFLPYLFTEEGASLATGAGALTFALGGLSKAAGLPQMKLGWMHVAGPARTRDEALARLEWLGDTYLSVSTPVQVGLGRFLASTEAVREAIRARLREHREEIRRLQGLDAPWEMLQADGGWYAVLRLPRIGEEPSWALRLLREEGVYVHPGELFDFEVEGHLVVSLLTSPDVFREGMLRLDRRVRALLA